MHKWNISNGSVEMIEDQLTRDLLENDYWIPDKAELEKLKELESYMTVEEANSVPKTAKLQLQVRQQYSLYSSYKKMKIS